MQRFPDLNGILSVYGEPSTGVAQALEQAGRLGKVKIAPGNQNNGWLKVLKQHPSECSIGPGIAIGIERDKEDQLAVNDFIKGKQAVIGSGNDREVVVQEHHQFINQSLDLGHPFAVL